MVAGRGRENARDGIALRVMGHLAGSTTAASTRLTYSCPPFITSLMWALSCNSAMSFRGFPSTATMSASFPAFTVPMSLSSPRHSAAHPVAATRGLHGAHSRFHQALELLSVAAVSPSIRNQCPATTLTPAESASCMLSMW